MFSRIKNAERASDAAAIARADARCEGVPQNAAAGFERTAAGCSRAEAHLKAEPVKPRRTQHGLFVPSSPEPEKLELTVARVRHLVGDGQVGTPELGDTHRPDSFLMRALRRGRQWRKGDCGRRKRSVLGASCVYGDSVHRRYAQVIVVNRRPVRVMSPSVNGRVVMAKGPWRTSGDWWRRLQAVESRRMGCGAGIGRSVQAVSRDSRGAMVH